MLQNKRLNLLKVASFLTIVLFIINCRPEQKLPEGFVFLQNVDATIIENVRYYTNQNFLGKPVPGYTSNRIVCSQTAAKQLKLAHDHLKQKGYTLVVYDAYRPQRAVDAFMQWSQDSQDLQVAKPYYYPTVDKKDVFKLGYVAEKSGHSRGSTFDLTIIKSDQPLKHIVISQRTLVNGETIPFLDDNTVDMGASFDLFHKVSHHDSKLVSKQQNENRELLRKTMKRYGFKEYQEEWWHYTLENEPYPDTYFNFIVE